MVRRLYSRRGVTLAELLIVVAILGIIVMFGPDAMTQITRFFILNRARIELQQEARISLSNITQSIRQAQSATVAIDQASGQPPYSRIAYTQIDGAAVTYWQSGTDLLRQVGTNQATLSRDLRYLAFTFPRSDDMTIVSVSMTLEKAIYQGMTKALHMASEKVQVMN